MTGNLAARALDRVPDVPADDVLADVDAFFSRFVAFPSERHRWAVTLWVVHTHALEAFESSPRLAVVAPEKQTGKTRA